MFASWSTGARIVLERARGGQRHWSTGERECVCGGEAAGVVGNGRGRGREEVKVVKKVLGVGVRVKWLVRGRRAGLGW